MFFTRLLTQKFSKLIKTTNTAKVLINSGAVPLKVVPIDIHKYNNGDHCLIEYETKDPLNNPTCKANEIRTNDNLDKSIIVVEGEFIKTDPIKYLKVHVPIFSNILTVEAENKGQKISVGNIEPTKLKIFIGQQKNLERWEKPIDELLVDPKGLAQHSYSPPPAQKVRSRGKFEKVRIGGDNKLNSEPGWTSVNLTNIKALRSITVKSKITPINLTTDKSIQTMRLTAVVPHLESKIFFNDTVKVRILDVEAGEINAKKSVFLKQGVVQSNYGDVNIKSIDSNSVLGVTSARNLLIREIEGQGQMTFNANEYMNVWLSPTVRNVSLNNRTGSIDLYTADGLKGQMTLDVPTKAELRLRQLAIIDPKYSLLPENIQKRHMHVDRRVIIDLGEEHEDEKEELDQDSSDLSQGKVTRSSKNDLSKELLKKEQANDPDFQPVKIHARAEHISVASMNWMKATFRKLEYQKPSSLNHIINDEKRKKELVTAHEEHFLFRS